MMFNTTTDKRIKQLLGNKAYSTLNNFRQSNSYIDTCYVSHTGDDDATMWILLGEYKTTSKPSNMEDASKADRPFGWTGWTNDLNYKRCVPPVDQWDDFSEMVSTNNWYGCEYVWNLTKWNPTTKEMTKLKWLEIDVEPTTEQKTVRAVKVTYPDRETYSKSSPRGQFRPNDDVRGPSRLDDTITECHKYVSPMDRNSDGSLSIRYRYISIGHQILGKYWPGTCRPGPTILNPVDGTCWYKEKPRLERRIDENNCQYAVTVPTAFWKVPVFTPMGTRDVHVVINPGKDGQDWQTLTEQSREDGTATKSTVCEELDTFIDACSAVYDRKDAFRKEVLFKQLPVTAYCLELLGGPKVQSNPGLNEPSTPVGSSSSDDTSDVSSGDSADGTHDDIAYIYMVHLCQYDDIDMLYEDTVWARIPAGLRNNHDVRRHFAAMAQKEFADEYEFNQASVRMGNVTFQETQPADGIECQQRFNIPVGSSDGTSDSDDTSDSLDLSDLIYDEPVEAATPSMLSSIFGPLFSMLSNIFGALLRPIWCGARD